MGGRKLNRITAMRCKVSKFDLSKNLRKGIRAAIATFLACQIQKVEPDLTIYLCLAAFLMGSALNIGEFMLGKQPKEGAG